MKQEAIHNYLETYFHASGCDILESRPGFLKIKLTVELDKLLMNRPFYWQYIEKIGGIPETQTLTLKTNASDEDGEFVHFGSPRLHQIFAAAKALSPYIRLYENKQPNAGGGQTPLYPWLSINAKMSLRCDLKKDWLLSLGLNLINGMVIKNFQESVEKIALTPKIPDYCYTLTPMIKPGSGLRRLEAVIAHMMEQEDHTWAQAAMERWQSDVDLLDRFYEDLDDDESIKEAYAIEKNALKEQYEPRITVSIINGGLFYLTDQFLP
ncbi:YqhG family protein [Camelliibacillus cellulosilyticus]|uniref:YqhG family protein n=1 Tax=Camelliibacillus cellulosilyticus TaxID=2174486 RepID=A0ABV9GMR0_9BACL